MNRPRDKLKSHLWKIENWGGGVPLQNWEVGMGKAIGSLCSAGQVQTHFLLGSEHIPNG